MVVRPEVEARSDGRVGKDYVQLVEREVRDEAFEAGFTAQKPDSFR